MNKDQREWEALVGRDRARTLHLSPAGYVGILEEWVVPIREGGNWQETMVWKLDERDVRTFLKSLSSANGAERN